jgi:hypothetical protein
VTVLFADLKGSKELLADRDPEEARRVFDPVLEQDDGRRPPVPRDRESGNGRRQHGAVWRAARPRGPRRPRLLRRPPDTVHALNHFHSVGSTQGRILSWYLQPIVGSILLRFRAERARLVVCSTWLLPKNG